MNHDTVFRLPKEEEEEEKKQQQLDMFSIFHPPISLQVRVSSFQRHLPLLLPRKKHGLATSDGRHKNVYGRTRGSDHVTSNHDLKMQTELEENSQKCPSETLVVAYNWHGQIYTPKSTALLTVIILPRNTKTRHNIKLNINIIINNICFNHISV